MKILVVGYPKSGCTWLTRLTAELVGCPSKGFYEEPDNPEIAIEGLERKSPHSVYKGHQDYNYLKNKKDIDRLIYIIRDVRDIVISGAHYYHPFLFYPWGTKLIKFTIISKILWKCVSQKRRIELMIKTVDRGSHFPWCEIPWDEHVMAFVKNKVFTIRYEDLLNNTFEWSQRILQYLNIKKDISHIKQSIQNQQFNNVKRKWELLGDKKRLEFMRSGKSGNWYYVLDENQIKFLEDRFYKTLHYLGYHNLNYSETKQYSTV